MTTTPPAQGLYDPANEHDACGVAFVVDLHGRRSHTLVQQGIAALVNLDHRGASGAEVNTGDGAGILIQVPDAFYRDILDVELPEVGRYATGIAFVPGDGAEVERSVEAVDKIVAAEGLEVLAWRDVPVVADALGSGALGSMPSFRQLFLAGPDGAYEGLDLERRAYVVRKRIEHEIGDADRRVYFPSLSCRTVVYKGMLTTPQLRDFYPDLADQRVESALALVHSRFSTNTFPSWPLAHP
ncbi:hypothetical protein BH20ACT3_BH20ACT3_18710 [soil metagenome]